MARYESYKELHTEVTAAANCPNPEELKSKIDIIINKFDSMHLEWNDEVKANFDNFKTSCIEFLKKISDSVGTNLVSAKDTYDDLKEILDKFQKDDATYNEKIENEPSPRYKVKGVYPNGATIYSSEETEEYSTWESEIDALNTAFNTYTIDIEKKKQTLLEINSQRIENDLSSSSLSSNAPIFEMPENILNTGLLPPTNGTPEENRDYIHDYLKSLGLTEAGIAGLFGSISVESSFIPGNLQNSFEGKYNDATYTAAIDSGDYSRERFIKDVYGYGLAQWTSAGRKEALYDFWKSSGAESISDLKMQTDFMVQELQNGYPGVWKTLCSSNDVFHCTDVVLNQYEMPRERTRNLRVRSGKANEFYNIYNS